MSTVPPSAPRGPEKRPRGANNATLPRRLPVWWLRHLYPRPDLVIFLDVPVDVLCRRKGEGTPEGLAERRRAHLEQLRRDPRIVRVDGTKPVGAVVGAVLERIDRDLDMHRGRDPEAPGHPREPVGGLRAR